MDLDDVEKLLRRLKCDKIRVGGNGWVHSSCPFAVWTHRRGQDAHPSFGISVTPDGTSRYRCHGCGKGGEVSRLLWALSYYSHEDYSDIAQWVINTNAPNLDEIQRRLDRAERGEDAAKPREVAGIRVSPKVAASLPDLESLPILPEETLRGFEDPEKDQEVWEFLTGVGEDRWQRKKKGLKPETV